METEEIKYMEEKQFESFKLIKNTRGYGWEIKIIPRPSEDDEKWIARLDKINTEFMKRFGVMDI